MDADTRTRRGLGRPVAVLLIAGAAVAGGVGLGRAFAATPATVFHACLTPGGSLEHVSTGTAPKCDDRESAVSWDQTGPQGAPGISGYQIVSNLQSSFPNFTQLGVNCPPGKRAIGGGAEALGPTSILNRTTPNTSGTGWIAVGHQPGVNSVGLHVYAICAVVLP